MKKIKSLLLHKDGIHYSAKTELETNNTSVKLFYTKYGSWAADIAGKMVCKITDDGNGVDIWHRDRGHVGRFNYGDLGDLLFLLNEYNLTTKFSTPFKRAVLANDEGESK